MNYSQMSFVLGAFVALSVALVVTLVVTWVKYSNINRNIDGLYKEIRDVHARVVGIPPTNLTQNVIHLGLKDGQMTTGLFPANLSIHPEDFQVRVDKLRAKLLHGFEIKSHSSTGTLAYCILDHAGMYELVNASSITEVKKALTRLLNNGDGEAIKRFLETLADSVCQGGANGQNLA